MEQNQLISASAKRIGEILEELAKEDRIESLNIKIQGLISDELHDCLKNLAVKDIQIITTSSTPL